MIGSRLIRTVVSAAPRVIPASKTRLRTPGAVALTIDDGPTPGSTEIILRTLEERAIRATWFFTGERIESARGLASECVIRGHAAANHGYVHRSMLFSSAGDVRTSIQRTSALVSETTGEVSRHFRPPYGHWNPFMANPVREFNMTLVLWSLMPMEFTSTVTLRDIEWSMTRGIRAGAIIVVHDSLQSRNRIADVLHLYADALERQNLRSITLPEEDLRHAG